MQVLQVITVNNCAHTNEANETHPPSWHDAMLNHSDHENSNAVTSSWSGKSNRCYHYYYYYYYIGSGPHLTALSQAKPGSKGNIAVQPASTCPPIKKLSAS
jgi:hypothetical protein